MRRSLLRAAVLLLCSLVAQGVAAQTYPAKPIRIIVPFAAGAFPDLVARIVGQKMSADLGQPVIIDNRPGAGGNIGTELVVRAAPDGYTLLLNSVANAIGASLYPSLRFDAAKDLAPISQMTSVANVLVVPPNSSINSLADLLSEARKRTLQYASGGPGTTSHLAGALIDLMAKVNMEHVPYRNFGQALTDVVAGRVDLVIPNLPPTLPQIKGGQLKAIAVTSSTRSPLLPDVPTMAESGLPGYQVTSWNGLAAPAATPKPIIARLNAEVAHALQDAKVVRALTTQGADIVFGSPEDYAALIKTETAKWAAVVTAAGVQIK